MNDYNLKEDHRAIKKRVKEWERVLTQLVQDGVIERRDTTKGTFWNIFDTLEELSHEMMAINL